MFRDCPKCGREISYKNKESFYRARKRNSLCKSCIQVGKKLLDETRQKMSESHIDIKRSPHTKEAKEKIGIKNKGKTSWNKGLTKETDERVRKNGESNKGKKRSEEAKKNYRLSLKKRIEDRCGQISPNYNSVGCEIIRWFNMYFDFNFQHAENGGEVCIDGYFPDGVDQEKMTIIEIDEKHHFNFDGIRKEKDIKRQRYLEGLGYKFIRVRI